MSVTLRKTSPHSMNHNSTDGVAERILYYLVRGYDVVLPFCRVRLVRKITNHNKFKRVDIPLSKKLGRSIVKQNNLTDGFYVTSLIYNNSHSVTHRVKLQKKFRKMIAEYYNANPGDIYKLDSY